ncbi:hypothetical protein HDU76_006351, partial [Blyttiomyces sp. JEL0837]
QSDGGDKEYAKEKPTPFIPGSTLSSAPPSPSRQSQNGDNASNCLSISTDPTSANKGLRRRRPRSTSAASMSISETMTLGSPGLESGSGTGSFPWGGSTPTPTRKAPVTGTVKERPMSVLSTGSARPKSLRRVKSAMAATSSLGPWKPANPQYLLPTYVLNIWWTFGAVAVSEG